MRNRCELGNANLTKSYFDLLQEVIIVYDIILENFYNVDQSGFLPGRR